MQGHFEARKDRFGLGIDFVYSTSASPMAADAPVIGALNLEADVRQLFTEGFAYYRMVSGRRDDNPAHLDVLLGARYVGTRTRLTAFPERDGR